MLLNKCLGSLVVVHCHPPIHLNWVIGNSGLVHPHGLTKEVSTSMLRHLLILLPLGFNLFLLHWPRCRHVVFFRCLHSSFSLLFGKGLMSAGFVCALKGVILLSGLWMSMWCQSGSSLGCSSIEFQHPCWGRSLPVLGCRATSVFSPTISWGTARMVQRLMARAGSAQLSSAPPGAGLACSLSWNFGSSCIPLKQCLNRRVLPWPSHLSPLRRAVLRLQAPLPLLASWLGRDGGRHSLTRECREWLLWQQAGSKKEKVSQLSPVLICFFLKVVQLITGLHTYQYSELAGYWSCLPWRKLLYFLRDRSLLRLAFLSCQKTEFKQTHDRSLRP